VSIPFVCIFYQLTYVQPAGKLPFATGVQKLFDVLVERMI